ncbi:MAG TPA: hypothetical protein VK850_11795 [Candidatus Binatia bacterium]|nr:hypothetical protein [Candidatus Binatia bacterium]
MRSKFFHGRLSQFDDGIVLVGQLAFFNVARRDEEAFVAINLSIRRSDSDVTLSWPTFYETFALHQNPNRANSNTWSNANYPLTTNGPTETATAPIAPTNHFFRLIGN